MQTEHGVECISCVCRICSSLIMIVMGNRELMFICFKMKNIYFSGKFRRYILRCRLCSLLIPYPCIRLDFSFSLFFPVLNGYSIYLRYFNTTAVFFPKVLSR